MNGGDRVNGGRLLVIAGGTVSRDRDGQFAVKAPIAQYLHGLAAEVGPCTWVALEESGTAYTSRLDPEQVRVVSVGRGWLARLRSWGLVAKLALWHELVLYFLPNHYLPLLPVFMLRARRFIVYLAGDYEQGIRVYASRRWPGWQALMRVSFEWPMRRADAVVVRGRMLARVARRFNALVYETVPMGHLGADSAAPRRSISSVERSRHRLIFIGKVVTDKGIGDLLQALKLLISRHPSLVFTLDVVGDGAELEDMQDMALRLGVAPRVVFHGWIAESAQIDALIRSADVLVVPSRLQYPEGVPRVIDEAILRSVPVVATLVGGIADEFADGEIGLACPGDPVSLTEGIEQVLFDGRTARLQSERTEARRRRIARYGSAAHQHLAILRGSSGEGH